MATPKAGAKVRAADLAGIFQTDTDAWSTYAPVITQSNTPTISTEYAQWMKIGRLVLVQISVGVTGTGTASNVVLCTFPAAAGTIVNFRQVGEGGIYDASANTLYEGKAIWNNATTFKIQAHNTIWSTAALGNGGGFTAALASGDLFVAQLMLTTTS